MPSYSLKCRIWDGVFILQPNSSTWCRVGSSGIRSRPVHHRLARVNESRRKYGQKPELHPWFSIRTAEFLPSGIQHLWWRRCRRTAFARRPRLPMHSPSWTTWEGSAGRKEKDGVPIVRSQESKRSMRLFRLILKGWRTKLPYRRPVKCGEKAPIANRNLNNNCRSYTTGEWSQCVPRANGPTATPAADDVAREEAKNGGGRRGGRAISMPPSLRLPPKTLYSPAQADAWAHLALYLARAAS